MQGSAKVIERLNGALGMELGAVHQYRVHHHLLEDMGVAKLAAKELEESGEELAHADQLIARIIFLGGTPDVRPSGQLKIGDNVQSILENDLAGEFEAQAYYKESRKICMDEGDIVSMNLFDALLTDEEGHIDFLETQLELFSKVGEANYITLNATSAAVAEGAGA